MRKTQSTLRCAALPLTSGKVTAIFYTKNEKGKGNFLTFETKALFSNTKLGKQNPTMSKNVKETEFIQIW
jgi:hypothetical protein